MAEGKKKEFNQHGDLEAHKKAAAVQHGLGAQKAKAAAPAAPAAGGKPAAAPAAGKPAAGKGK